MVRSCEQPTNEGWLRALVFFAETINDFFLVEEEEPSGSTAASTTSNHRRIPDLA